jgi:hypothetical protein
MLKNKLQEFICLLNLYHFSPLRRMKILVKIPGLAIHQAMWYLLRALKLEKDRI